MRIRGIGRETLVLHAVQTVNSVGKHLLCHAVQVVTYSHGFELHTKFLGEHTPFGQKFEAHVGNFAILDFKIYYKIILVHWAYPIVWLSSLMRSSMAASLSSSTRHSFVANTTFSTFFTFVGEPGRPICEGSAST